MTNRKDAAKPAGGWTRITTDQVLMAGRKRAANVWGIRSWSLGRSAMPVVALRDFCGEWKAAERTTT